MEELALIKHNHFYRTKVKKLEHVLKMKIAIGVQSFTHFRFQ